MIALRAKLCLSQPRTSTPRPSFAESPVGNLHETTFHPAIHCADVLYPADPAFRLHLGDMALLAFYDRQPPKKQQEDLNKAIILLERYAQKRKLLEPFLLVRNLKKLQPNLKRKNFPLVAEFADRIRLCLVDPSHVGNQRRFPVLIKEIKRKSIINPLFRKLAFIGAGVFFASACIAIAIHNPVFGLIFLGFATALFLSRFAAKKTVFPFSLSAHAHNLFQHMQSKQVPPEIKQKVASALPSPSQQSAII